MPQQHVSPEMPDLFGVVQPSSGARTEPIRVSAKRSTPKLASLSDAELAAFLTDLMREVQQRLPDAQMRRTRPELDRAVEDATSVLTRLASSSSEQPTRLATAGALQQTALETKRKAIRAALLAGVKPGQVAKHFGVPLAAVRQIATKTPSKLGQAHVRPLRPNLLASEHRVHVPHDEPALGHAAPLRKRAGE